MSLLINKGQQLHSLTAYITCDLMTPDDVQPKYITVRLIQQKSCINEKPVSTYSYCYYFTYPIFLYTADTKVS